jgi:GNAT superfamily N-acetyltransferase
MIRAAGPDDASALARLRYDFRVELDSATEAESTFLERCRSWMATRLTSGTAWKCWLAVEADRPIGAAWLQLLEKIPNPVGEPELHGYISSLFVIAERRGTGVGSALLKACLQECESRGAEAVFLWPTPLSRPLYRRHGFEVRDDMLERRLHRSAGVPH